MNCLDALDALLTVDFSNGSGHPPELLDHLTLCRRCERVAATLQSQSEALAGVSRAVPLSLTSPTATTTFRAPRVAAFAFAALMLVVLWPSFSRRPGSEGRMDRESPRSALTDTTTSAAARGTPQRLISDSSLAQRMAIAAGRSAARVRPGLNTTSAAASAQALDQRVSDLGTLLDTPEPVEAVPLLAVEIEVDVAALAERELTLDNSLEAPDAGVPEATSRTPVLLRQSNPHITVFWVF